MPVPLANVFSRTNFSALDWGIVAGYLSVSVVIGLLVRKYVRNMADFVTAGRGLGTCLGIATLTGTEMGLVTLMYSAQKGFVGGFAAFHIAVAAGVVTFFVGLTGLIVYRLRKLNLLTIPEFYERRFGPKTRILGGVMLALGGILNMGLFLKVGSIFIVGVTGLSTEGWALPTVMTVLLVLVLVYTVLGGMISVVITDYIQFVVLSAGMIGITILSARAVGWEGIFGTIQAEMGERGFNPLAAEGGFGIEYVIWMVFLGLVGCALWPTAVARALAAESPQTVKKQFMWSSVSYMIRNMAPYFWGVCAFGYIATQSPELQEAFFPAEGTGTEMNNLYAMPIFLGRVLPAGVLGIITAAMIAAFMSTHDSYLLCWSSVITQDIVAPIMKNRLSTSGRIRLTRILIVAIGAYILYWGLIYKGADDVWDYMAVTGAIYFTGAFALLVGGLYWKRASSTGAVMALVAGCSAILGLGPVQDLLGITIPSARMGLISIGLTVTAMVVGSLLFPDKPKPAAEAPSRNETAFSAGAASSKEDV